MLGLLSHRHKVLIALLVAAALGLAVFHQQLGISRCIIDVIVVLLLSGAGTILLAGLYDHIPSAEMFNLAPPSRGQRIKEIGPIVLICALLIAALAVDVVHCLSHGTHIL